MNADFKRLLMEAHASYNLSFAKVDLVDFNECELTTWLNIWD